MDARPLSRLLLLAAICLVILGCARAAAPGGHSNARAVISQVSGDLRITNSRNGQAIFQASGLAPGRSVTGTVQLSNTGSLAGALSLAQLDVLDQPGANGGRLSDAVHLNLQDVTGGSAIPVFAGQLRTVGSRALGSLAPGEARTYRFTASLPDHGAPATPTSGDNAYAGSRVTVRYAWTATAPDGSGGGGTGAGGTAPAAPVVKLKIVSKKLLKRGVLDVLTTCDVACRITAYAQLPKAKRARKVAKTRRRTATLTIPNTKARIRLKLSRKTKKQLMAALRKKKRVVLLVRLTVSAASGGPSKAISRKVVVRRPKTTRR
jgi:spore coat-associated protein N